MLAKSPLLRGIRKLFGRPQATKRTSYHAFTTAYDRIVDAVDLPKVLPEQRPEEAESFDKAARRFDNTFSSERITIGAAAAQLVRHIQETLSQGQRAKTVVSFLIDHSGSMRGLRMLSALLAVEGAVDAPAHAGVATEILGFTTSSWKGGRSRQAWLRAGKPANPGRLCDLLHVIYAGADRVGPLPWYLRDALRPDLLRENIDGEALEWAVLPEPAPPRAH